LNFAEIINGTVAANVLISALLLNDQKSRILVVYVKRNDGSTWGVVLVLTGVISEKS
jgi:hypothetical protein